MLSASLISCVVLRGCCCSGFLCEPGISDLKCFDSCYFRMRKNFAITHDVCLKLCSLSSRPHTQTLFCVMFLLPTNSTHSFLIMFLMTKRSVLTERTARRAVSASTRSRPIDSPMRLRCSWKIYLHTCVS
jgi:hypothetical protein